ncbi:MAG TPA: CRTAC1 family protein [Vicinamibacterales bacterium]|nr:CRTAC1 family protein [Vicinamibacterales bacterium]
MPLRQRIAWAAWTIVLIASLSAVYALNRQAEGRHLAAHDETGDTRFGFRLRESSKALGVDFTHQAPTFDSRFDHIMPQVAAMGASVAVTDFNRDGWQDLYVTNSGEDSLNRLYRNDHGTFVDVAGQVGLADVNRRASGVSMGSVWGDFDNDGWEDVLVYKYGRPELFRNIEGRSFTPVGERAGLPPWVNANSATWLDYDRDGNLDLFIAGYWPESVNLWQLETTRVMPESFEYATNGGRKYLLRNRGDGTFEDRTEAMGIRSRRWALALIAADLLGTGYPDLFLSNDYGVSELFANRNGKRFDDVAAEAGVGMTPKSGMNASVGDIFNDGRLAIYKTNITEPGQLLQGNDLWIRESEQSMAFENLASSLKIDLGGWSWGAQFGDLNNDGTQDLYLTNGYVSAGERTSYWYDFSVIATGHSTIIGDAKNWPAMRGRSLSGYQRKRVWVNDGAGRFTDVAQVVGATDTFDGRAVALADLGNRGVLDVIVANQRGPLLIYRNTVQPGRHWIQFELESPTHRSPFGARVELYWSGRKQVQEVTAASGFSAQNQRRVHYGLGSAAAVDRVVIRWPSGQVQTIEKPEINRLHLVKESDGR